MKLVNVSLNLLVCLFNWFAVLCSFQCVGKAVRMFSSFACVAFTQKYFLKLLCLELSLPPKQSSQITEVTEPIWLIRRCGCSVNLLCIHRVHLLHLLKCVLTRTLRPCFSTQRQSLDVVEHVWISHNLNRRRAHKVDQVKLDRIIRATRSNDGCLNQTKHKRVIRLNSLFHVGNGGTLLEPLTYLMPTNDYFWSFANIIIQLPYLTAVQWK